MNTALIRLRVSAWVEGESDIADTIQQEEGWGGDS